MPRDTTCRDLDAQQEPLPLAGSAQDLTQSQSARSDDSGADTAAMDDAAAQCPPAKRAGGARPQRMTPGDELEMRLARMYFWRGAYTRRGVNLQRHFHPEPLLVTDLDLLAVDITSQLTLNRTIGEAKSGTGKNAPKPLDRAIWIAGLKQLVGATGAIVLTATRASVQVRATARSLGVTCFTIDELQRWESAHLNTGLSDVGAQGPSAYEADDAARRILKGEPRLERMYWFLKSEVWFLDSWRATKRLLGGIGDLKKYWTPDVDDAQSTALRWMYAEAISILTLQLIELVGIYQSSDFQSWPSQVNDRLAEGAIPAANQRALASTFDKYLAHVLGELKAPPQIQVETMGAFFPTPPQWAEALIELLARLESFNGLHDLPRQTDLVMGERLVRRRHVSTEALAAVSARDPEDFARARRQIAAFIRGSVGLPEAVDKAMSA
ncbi:DNA-binding response regulator [Mycobacteroides abscessus]|nr:DNA-binding response regulator [Mycobacteroides abscessus]